MLNKLTTETRNLQTANLDQLSSLDILKLMNEEDKKVAFAVEQQLKSISKVIDIIVIQLEKGGRLFYFGAGTSGRFGVLDASECPPTFNTDPELVQGIIAGGKEALSNSVEDAEDNMDLGKEDVRKYGVCERDVIVGIAASGRTPYVIGALQEAKAIQAVTVSLTCNPDSEMGRIADMDIHVVVGPEIVTGSTRLKAGTAQKLVLNMISTTVMIRLGKVYGNLMVSVRASNQKLKERVKHIIMEAVNASYSEAAQLAERADWDARIAVVMKKTGLDMEEALILLESTKWKVREAIHSFDENLS